MYVSIFLFKSRFRQKYEEVIKEHLDSAIESKSIIDLQVAKILASFINDKDKQAEIRKEITIIETKMPELQLTGLNLFLNQKFLIIDKGI